MKSKNLINVFEIDCDEDIRRVFQNAQDFNPAHHPIHDAAGTLAKNYAQDSKKLLDHFAEGAGKRSSYKRRQNACPLCHEVECAVCDREFERLRV